MIRFHARLTLTKYKVLMCVRDCIAILELRNLRFILCSGRRMWINEPPKSHSV